MHVEPETRALPTGCTFLESDWRALAPQWFPVAFAKSVKDSPVPVRLLDEKLVAWRTSDGTARVARDLCLHRGAPLSLGSVAGDELVCKYHGFRYGPDGQCVKIPAHPGAAIPPKLCLRMHPVREAFGLIWTQVIEDPSSLFPDFSEWDDPAYVQIMPDSVKIRSSAGRQVEGFLDVSHFATVHAPSFGEPENPVVPNYSVVPTPGGFKANYVSSVSNYSTALKHMAPANFKWSRLFEVFFPFTAKLTVQYPHGKLHVLNAACPISAKQSEIFVPICRDFDKDAPLEDTLDFNHQVFAEDKELVESQCPEELPIDLLSEVHIRADKSSIAYRQGLARMGLGRSFSA
ncbi:MAG TPA: aromatic ring-hydroxylating dioxygenase subunit alpha [Opitutaceae bacterium]|jgi:vanillate O-demethylase monooxygenase subunit|nr:aromatic ring-hydroxylating dioxygenase subunit alpha [Opitutaceae bacterium]